MKIGDKLQIVQNDEGETVIYFVASDYESHKMFPLADALEAIIYLLLDEEGRGACLIN